MAVDFLDICAIIIICIVIVLSFFILCGLKQYYNHKSERFYSAKLTVLTMVLLLERSFYVIATIASGFNHLSSQLYTFVRVITPLIWSIFISFYLFYYYIKCYEHNYNWKKLNKTWKIFLQAEYTIPDKLSQKTIIQRSICVWLPITSILILLNLYQNEIPGYKIIVDILAILILIFAQIYIKRVILQNILDDKYQYKEMLFQLKFVCIVCLIEIIVSLTFYFINYQRIESFCNWVLGYIVIFGINYISTAIPFKFQRYAALRKQQFVPIMDKLWSTNKELDYPRDSLDFLTDSVPQYNKYNLQHLKYIEIKNDIVTAMSHQLGVELMLEHLVKLYYSETMIFLIELSQIKYNYYLKQNKIFKCFEWNLGNHTEIVIDFRNLDLINLKYLMFLHGVSTECNKWIKICDSLPESMFITDTDYNSVYLQMKGMYERYIKIGSEFELNLSHQMRSQLDAEFIDVSDEHVIFDGYYINLFDMVVEETCNFFWSSWCFKQWSLTEQYLLFRDQVNCYDVDHDIKSKIMMYYNDENNQKYIEVMDEYYQNAINRLTDILGVSLCQIVMQYIYE
eukprot:41374_1